MIAGAAIHTACSIYEQGSVPNKYNPARRVPTRSHCPLQPRGRDARNWRRRGRRTPHQTRLSYDDEIYDAQVELARTLIASQLDGAEREINRAMADNPHDSDVDHLTARLRATQGKLPDARDHMNRAKRHGSVSIRVHHG